MRRLVIGLGIFLGVALVAAMLSAGRAASRVAIEKREDASRALSRAYERHRAQLDADEARWANDPLVVPRDGGNAATLLSEHVGWDPSDAGLPLPSKPLPPAVMALLRQAQDGGWVDLRDEALLAVDVGWLSELSAQGYWDPEEPALSGRPFDVYADPVPDLVSFSMLAKVRLIQGLHSGAIAPAAADVREMARLAFSSETLLGSMIAISLLGLERRAYAAAVARGLDVASWSPVSGADAEQLKALAWVAPAMTSVLATGSLAARTPKVGECAALREGVGSAHYLRAYLERELPDRYAELDRQLQTSPCRLQRLRAAWNGRSSLKQLPATTRAFCVADPSSSACTAPELPLAVAPYSTSFIGNTVLVIGSPDWFKQYDRRRAGEDP